MKVKFDFVTNSSSANMILDITLCNELDCITKSNTISYIKNKLKSLYQVNSNTCKTYSEVQFSCYTAMYNDAENFPKEFLEIYLSFYFGTNKLEGIKDVELKIEDLH